MHKKDKLKTYIEKSVLRVVNDDFRIRLSKELAAKYDAGAYTNSTQQFADYIEQIKKLGLQYPASAKPIFYMYLVPDDDFIELLRFPYQTRKSGGRPVASYDMDGFNSAYGQSQNMSDDTLAKQPNTARIVNNIHELAHLVHSQFFDKNRLIAEGFAEALPLYTMDYDSQFDEHRNVLKSLKPDQIYSQKNCWIWRKMAHLTANR
jgi:hypothetical protein